MTDHLPDEAPSVGPQTGWSPASGGSLEELLAVVAHEIRSPLSVVQTAAETAVARDLSGQQLRELLEIIRRNADLAVLLVNRLSLARDVEAGTFTLDTAELDLLALTTETVSDLAPSIAGRHEVRVTGTAPVAVRADETSLREILFNLLLNAAKYSPVGSEIEVSVMAEDGTARLTVRDHGGGVSEADRDRIFEKYEQVDRGASGVGLGLYISRGLARANGGDLAVEPRGAAVTGGRFVLALPVANRTV